MCWSLEVSIITLVAELLGVGFVLVRAHYSSVPEIKAQKYHMIAFLSVIIVEAVEVLLWMNPNEISPIEDAINGTCSSRNSWLTRILYPNVAFQATIFTYVIGSENDPNVDKGHLKLLQNMSIWTFTLLMVGWFLGEWFAFMVMGVESSAFKSMLGKVTCTYLGKNGHLHWVFKTSQAWFLPMIGSIHIGMLPFIAFLSGMPLVPHALPIVIQLFWFAVALIYTQGSAEAASIWCWTGASLLAVAIVMPYLVTFPSQLKIKNK